MANIILILSINLNIMVTEVQRYLTIYFGEMKIKL
jgi:hypothetical protein